MVESVDSYSDLSWVDLWMVLSRWPEGFQFG